MESLTFKQRLQLYKAAKKPRKQIRLKLEIITNGLNLPRVRRCENKVNQIFKLVQCSKIEPQINEHAQKYTQYRETKTAALEARKQNLKMMRYENQVHYLRTLRDGFRERLRVNLLLEGLGREEEICGGGVDGVEGLGL